MLECLIVVFGTCRYVLSKQSAFLWVPTVLPFSSTLFVREILDTGASQEKRREVSRSFKFTFRYIDGVLSLNNSEFCDFVYRISLIVLEITDTMIQLVLLHTLTCNSKLTVRVG